MSYPVQIDTTSPLRFDRVQLALRLVIAIALGWVGISASWLGCVLFLALPVIAAVAISTRGAQAYLDDTGPRVWRVVSWLLAFSAYMLLLTDRFPTGEPTGVQVQIQPDGHPTTSSALLRLIMSLPSAIVLALLGFVSSVLFVVGAVMILIEERVPAGILGFQRGVLRWQARLAGYHASLVDEYPPFSLEADPAQPGDHAHTA
ncbi:MAG TPA: DUF4389 domain-containing protein [Kofleriaceae bacterium]|nr:DUF4389 domain-containing protein [Kofleriaceae bacterium]